MLLYSIYLMITGNKASTIPPIPIPGIGCSRFWFWGLGIEMFSNKIDKVVYLGTRLNCTTPIDYVLWRNWIYVNLYCEKSLTFYSASGLSLTYLNTLLWHASTHSDFFVKRRCFVIGTDTDAETGLPGSRFQNCGIVAASTANGMIPWLFPQKDLDASGLYRRSRVFWNCQILMIW